MNTKKLTFLKMFTTVLCLLTLAFGIVPIFKATENKIVVADDSSTAEHIVYIHNGDCKSIATPKSDGYLYFVIAVKDNVSSSFNVKAYYRFRNLGAIKGVDYTEAEDGYTALSSLRNNITFAVKCNVSTYSVTDTDGNLYTRQFEIEIYKLDVINGSVALDKNQSVLTCNLKATYNLNIESSANFGDKQFKYINQSNFVEKKLSTGSNTIYGTDDYSIDTSLSYSAYPELDAEISKYLQSGIGEYYCWFDADVVEPDWTRNSDGYLYVTIQHDGKNIFKGSYYNFTVWSYWSRINFGGHSSDVDTNSENYYGNEPTMYDEGTKAKYFNLGTGGQCNFIFYSKYSLYRKFGTCTAHYKTLDKIAPKITYYAIDSSTKDLRLSVRFSEPVQFDTSTKPVVQCKIGNVDVNFDYLAGQGSDTLVFHYDMNNFSSSTTVATEVKVLAINNATTVVDFSGRKNGLPSFYNYGSLDEANQSPEKLGITLSYNVDTYKPNIELTVKNATTKTRSKLFDIKVTNLSSDATIQYCWSKTDAMPADDQFKKVSATNNEFSYTQGDLSGKYYLFARATSAFGKVTTEMYTSPCNFDNEAPQINSYTINDALLSTKNKTIQITYKDLPTDCASEIDELALCYSTKPITIYNYSVDSVFNIKIFSQSENINRLTDVSSEGGYVTKSFNVTAEDFGIDAGEYQTIYVSFYIKDALGNGIALFQTEDSEKLFIDNRDDVSVDVVEPTKTLQVNDDTALFDSSASFTFNLDNSISNISFNVKTVSYNGVEQSDYSNLLKFDLNSLKSINMTGKGASGYYYVVFSIKLSETIEKLYGYNFYLGKLGTDKTTNSIAINNTNLVINKLYGVSGIQYYYKGADGQVYSELYNNTTKTLMFSSADVAYSYFYYFEQLDFYAYKIESSAVATNLNTGTGVYKKATGETQTAVVGQIWIRYKRTNWDMSKSSNDWAYYFYDVSDTKIDMNKLSANLLNTIDVITKKIISYGSMQYLTSYSDLDSLGCPTLLAEQISYDTLTASVSKSNSVFTQSDTYNGDAKIYNTIQTKDEISYITATNFVLNVGTYTNLYFANAQDIVPTFYSISAVNQTILSTYINATGYYILREVDGGGISETYIYIDKTVPTIQLVYTPVDSTEQYEITGDQTINGQEFNDKLVSIKSITDTDPYAFVAVFNYRTGLLTDIYYAEDLKKTSIILSSGKYVVEVYDRFGNNYSFIVRLSDSQIDCKVTAKENVSLKFECDLASDDVYDFSVTLNGKVITTTYESILTYYNSGIYEIYIEDIYGNSETITRELVRTIPSVQIKYEYDGNVYTYSSGDNVGIVVKQNNESDFKMYASGVVNFVYGSSDGYLYTISDGANYTETNNLGTITLKIQATSDWSVKFYYEKYPEISVIYKCKIDKNAPTMNAVYIKNSYVFDEMANIVEQFGNAQIGDILGSKSISFGKNNETIEINIANNQSVNTTNTKVYFADDTLVTKVMIYINGSLYKTLQSEYGISEVSLDEYGVYKIVAYDILNNSSIFNYEIKYVEALAYYVGAEKQNVDYDATQYFGELVNGAREFSKQEYGNTEIIYKYATTGEIVIVVDDGAKKSFYYFVISDGKLLMKQYVASLSDTSSSSDKPDSIEILTVETFDISTASQNTYTSFASAVNSGVEFYIMTDGTNVFVKLICPENANEYTISQRFLSDVVATPYYTKTIISKKVPNTQIITDAGTSSSADVYNINSTFGVSILSDDKVVKVEIAYSASGTFDKYKVYDLTTLAEQEFADAGFYSIRLTNIFGTEKLYAVNLIKEFKIVYQVVHQDGDTFDYSLDYEGNINSNNKINITAYAVDITVELYKNGEAYSPTIIEGSAYKIIVLEGEGSFTGSITDKYGNVNNILAEIKVIDISFDESLVVGYNDKALKKADGYTNTLLTIAKQQVDANDLKYIAIKFGTKITRVLDLIAENLVEYSAQNFEEAIGVDGTGTYQIIFKDKYGNLCSKTIEYRAESTLKLSRNTLSSRIFTDIALDFAVENGLNSNQTIKIETTSQNYIFKVDNLASELAFEMTYESSSFGKYSHTFYYLDEYGFEYNIVINLIRQEVDYKTQMEVQDIGDKYYTSKDICLTFKTDYIASYTYQGATYDYVSGQTLYSDGDYRFVISDLADNKTSYIITKDTLVQFQFVDSGNNKVLTNGDVANQKVTFSALESGLTYKYVLLNGVVQEKYDSSSFSGAGYWRIVVADEVGNERYFAFYLLSQETTTLLYDTPYGYKITEITFDNGNGKENSMIEYVVDNGSNSSFDFNETGNYKVSMKSNATNAISSFYVDINNAKPAVKLVGCKEGDTTTNNITITGYQIGDTIKIYKDKNLIKTINVTSSSTSVPTISDKGDYKIEVSNIAGNVTTLTFSRLYTANGASSAFIIFVILLASTILFVGLVYRKKSRVD